MSDKAVPPDIERDPTHLAAAEWFVRLQGAEVSIEETLEWQGWMNDHPRNAEAFARIEETSQAVRSLPAPAALRVSRIPHDRYDASVPLKDWDPTDTAAPQRESERFQATAPLKDSDRHDSSAWDEPRGLHHGWRALALAAGLAALALAALLWPTTPPSSRFATAVGENRTVRLTDGSTIALGGDTQIEVALSPSVRAIDLKRGEALFKVAKDPARPFKVQVGAATVIAVGTEFNVQRGSDRAIVSVTEGRVVVEPVSRFLPVYVLQELQPSLRTVHLQAGQQTMTGSAGIEEPTQVDDPTATTAWQTGRLAFHLQPLRYVLEDVNRYAPKPIVLGDEALGALVITGTVEGKNIGGWIESLERAFELQATEESDRIVLRPR